ncbi:UDP-N-acetylmuramate--L-alanine ligase [Magnetococcus marinus MC-1]|uniref:UDP-N-acetylmuramate--L-alanine ligase n=1 Tax=Magnetococcus marinus (strain ATCC BAA-1437 / JCM 17883 / MC-1) TaxID=156889 RepID=MURC_MAGMM|nr:UDP-N-acetylmuramate--L-alanine ligase [Magnetococcus marinus]A0L5N0.1 RecName: Full=UDP-N-acetylmuramate--L-alanine ligase; AltName: Full=UDP-N-acetylmuramoyl-L-alanine synthetase [Magnetococcus marinus MC-1]ABK43273.1 UDP-N-acetylmuramate--L-alanine ligase [Magnetococcus marinus MC-1]
MYPKIQHIHFVGIGGIGMSGIAEVLLTLGYRVSGSDLSENANIKRLRDKGAHIQQGHTAQAIEGADAVVTSSAVKRDNPEVMAARALRIPVVPRAEMLAELMRLKYGIAIAGTHGKTTTTSLVAALLGAADMDPTVVNGGIVKSLGSNAHVGQGAFLVTEADESDGSFLKLSPTIAVVTNMDPEHMNHYGTFDAVREAFRGFVSKIPFYGLAVLCGDHPEVSLLAEEMLDKRVITYGLSDQVDLQAVHIRQEGIVTHFEVIQHDRHHGRESRSLGTIQLNMPGCHNVSNTLAALAVAMELAVPWERCVRALAGFGGVQRRFDLLHQEAAITIIDDYAHHPVEIAATMEAVRNGYPQQRVVAVFQPHRYSRVLDHMHDFCRCFKNADVVLVDEIYRAGEQPPEGPLGEQGAIVLVEGIRRHSSAQVALLADDARWGLDLGGQLKPNDVVVFLGAGDISRRAHSFAAGWSQQTDPKTV